MNENRNIPKMRFPGFTDGWKSRKLGDIFKYEQPQKYLVESADYDDSYQTPVLTAGQTFILGYTDETNGIKEASKKAPVVIFDDFTTSSHLVDFSFKVKSSAMKFLTLRDDRDDLYCAYEVLQNVDYTPSNHQRQWISVVSDIDVNMPSAPEQQRIGSFFSKIDSVIALQQQYVDQLKEFKKGCLQKMFPKKGETVPEMRFSGAYNDKGEWVAFTGDWEQRKLGNIFDYEQPTPYIVSSTDYDDSFETPVLTAGQSFILGYTDETDGIKNANPNEPVIIFDDFTTSSHYVDFPFKVKSSAMKLLSLKDNTDDIYCTKNILQNIDYVPASHERHWISIFSDFDVFIPSSKDEQKKIGDYFRSIDNLITLHQRKLDEMKEFKKGCLQKMFV